MIDSLIKDSIKLVLLLEEVEILYDKKAIFTIDNNLKAQGGFDYQNIVPSFTFRSDTINEANIAHELIHALQYKQGFPIIIKNLTTDKRFDVIKELNSNLLHIGLVEEMKKREIPIKDYIVNVVEDMKTFINDDTKVTNMKNAIPERKHYDALQLLRLEFEANYLSKNDKDGIYKMYKKKMPEVYKLFVRMIQIIKKFNMQTGEGVALALKEIIKLFSKDKDYSKYSGLLSRKYFK